MSILAKYGGYQFDPTDRPHLGLGHHNRRALIPNISSSTATQYTRGLPVVDGKTMAANDAHQTELAEEKPKYGVVVHFVH